MADRRPGPYYSHGRVGKPKIADSARLMRMKELKKDIPESNANFDKVMGIIKLIEGAESILHRENDPEIKAIVNAYIDSLFLYAQRQYFPNQLNPNQG